MLETSAAAQIILCIVPIVGIVIGGVIIFFFLLWRHHEIKQRIKAGSYTPTVFNLRVFSLLTGILLTGIGAVLTIFFFLLLGKSLAILGGLIPFAIGVCLLIFYKVNPDFNER